VLAIDPDEPGPARSYDPEIWVDPKGKLWVFWAQAMAHSGAWSLIKDGTLAGVWAISTKKPDTGTPSWSKPRRLTDGVMMCKPVVLSSGEWVLPASSWNLTEKSARMVVSNDRGKTWLVRGAASVPEDVRSFDEHLIVERKDQSLWMLVRTKYGIGESISNDNGLTWSPLIPSKIEHPNARFFIRRLKSGNLLLVKHGPIDKQTDRSQLMAFVSKDDGHSWSGGLLLDERSGVSYPDGQQVEDGSIFIIYDYHRKSDQNILMASFTEDDVLSGDPESESVTLRRLVSKGGSPQD
jgi:predicted neuraminidase